MDKHSRKISVKLNGVEKNFSEDVNKEEEENQRAVKTADFEWVLPVAEKKYSNVVPFYHKNEHEKSSPRLIHQKERGAGKKITAIILAASLLGTGFGFIVLHVIGGNERTASQISSQNSVKEIKQSAAVPATESSKSGSVRTIEPFSLRIIQGGAFTTMEKADQSLQEIKQQGLPATIMKTGDKMLVLIGIFNEKETAKAIELTYKKKGISIWEKNMTTTGGPVRKEYEKQAETIAAGNSFLTHMIEAASILYSGGKISQQKWDEFQNEFKSLSSQSKEIKQGEIKKFLGYSTLSYNALAAYKQSKSEADFLELQQFLLDGFAAYEEVASKILEH
ncbi:SPOR domain-containing protein [Bacillus sp. 165]|uniref:SPOR domain-containing protein n=1 Tax=Bacillus sp. 165 TaxID=1529117 RepID=UPI001AD968D0|nr:SPOR domain-containing protein [Bacillus sp. 165]MBO9130510.1 SPOR domain-containing protein [Bacillus sp. 165]